jgi:hypothetical protein
MLRESITPELAKRAEPSGAASDGPYCARNPATGNDHHISEGRDDGTIDRILK